MKHFFGIRLVILFLLLLPAFGSGKLSAQTNEGYAFVSRIISRIPESATASTDALSAYINQNLNGQRDKSLAAFLWISRNMEYDFDSIITNSIFEAPEEVSDRMLKTRTGVCLNFVLLFTEILNKCGIPAVAVQGYTRQNGRIDFLPHIWSAGYVDSVWCLFDPTWGSGYTISGRYIRQFNGAWFMAKPEHFIRTHMPFDPIWQLLYYPNHEEQFKKGKYKPDVCQPVFNFNDSIKAWYHASPYERASLSARRLETYGAANHLSAAKLRVLKGDMIYYRNKNAAERYDSAIRIFNHGILSLNRFIQYRNERFGLEDDSLAMAALLDSTTSDFSTAISFIQDISSVEPNIMTMVSALRNEINEKQMVLNLQKAWLRNHDQHPQRTVR